MQTAFQFEEDLLMKEVFNWEHSETEKGQIYTRPEVIEFMLKCIGLNDCEDLQHIRILEPSCGEGEFVISIADRFINRLRRKPSANQLLGRVLAIDLVGASVNVAKAKVGELLRKAGYSKREIDLVLDDWFLTTDFLLENIKPNFTHVIGNPPYVRVENVPKKLLIEYRNRFSTMTDRADLYIPFFEKSLSLLLPGGKLSFICTDRWTKNTYGKSLRKLINDNYSLELFINLYGNDAFEQDVMTYPAITQIRKSKGVQTALMHETNFAAEDADEVAKALKGLPSTKVQIRTGIVNGPNPWLFGTKAAISVIQRLELQYPTLEEAGCEVFIGAATGANEVYIVDSETADIEESRLLPVITAKELTSGRINWRGKYLINTYDKSGVIDLKSFPKLARYLNSHKDQLCGRHVAKREVDKWFKTIDRVYEDRAKREKLLIPDISSGSVVVYDAGKYHPNNSIYYICSNCWNLHALRVVLLSNVTSIFISTYSTKIANGYLRFQAQHLRRIRLPIWESVDEGLRERMIEAGMSNNEAVFSILTYELYGLSNGE
jgi:methylase of polypeptide subunit release factors